jgi:hypothetical protein
VTALKVPCTNSRGSAFTPRTVSWRTRLSSLNAFAAWYGAEATRRISSSTADAPVPAAISDEPPSRSVEGRFCFGVRLTAPFERPGARLAGFGAFDGRIVGFGRAGALRALEPPLTSRTIGRAAFVASLAFVSGTGVMAASGVANLLSWLRSPGRLRRTDTPPLRVTKGSLLMFARAAGPLSA